MSWPDRRISQSRASTRVRRSGCRGNRCGGIIRASAVRRCHQGDRSRHRDHRAFSVDGPALGMGGGRCCRDRGGRSSLPSPLLSFRPRAHTIRRVSQATNPKRRTPNPQQECPYAHFCEEYVRTRRIRVAGTRMRRCRPLGPPSPVQTRTACAQESSAAIFACSSAVITAEWTVRLSASASAMVAALEGSTTRYTIACPRCT